MVWRLIWRISWTDTFLINVGFYFKHPNKNCCSCFNIYLKLMIYPINGEVYQKVWAFTCPSFFGGRTRVMCLSFWKCYFSLFFHVKSLDEWLGSSVDRMVHINQDQAWQFKNKNCNNEEFQPCPQNFNFYSNTLLNSSWSKKLIMWNLSWVWFV